MEVIRLHYAYSGLIEFVRLWVLVMKRCALDHKIKILKSKDFGLDSLIMQ